MQQQVKYLLENLLHCETEKVLSGNIVPFTSPNQDYLTPEDWLCGKEIWEKIFNRYIEKNGKVNIIVMGKSAENAILEIFKNTESEISKIATLQTGWGNITARFYKNKNKNSTDNIKMCYLPHLSRFGVFDRQQQSKNLEQYIQDFFN